MKRKVWVMIGAIATAFVVAACSKSEAYRSIMVYQVDGSATITREHVGEMEAYENLMLQSGDSVAVASESSVRLKLDDDKYILAEQDTRMNIVADGDDENARTYIDLQQGSVTSEIQNKLKDGASYEVNTPNSIMAVRGTIFRVDVEIDEDQNTNTKLTVFQGTVSARAVLPDGTISDEEVLVEAGNELTIEGTPEDAEDLGEPAGIDYESLPEIITEYLDELEQSGQKLAARTTENAPQAQEPEEAQDQNGADADTQEVVDAADADVQEVVDAADEAAQNEADQKEATAKTPKTTSKPQSETPQKPQNPQEPDADPNPNPEQNPQEPNIPQIEQPDLQTQESEPQKVTPDPNPNPTPQGATSDGDQDSGQSSGGGSKKKTQYYTVTFQYNGSTFGTQEVKKGETATEPKLCPTENGAWDYDFSQKVDKNLTIQWKAN